MKLNNLINNKWYKFSKYFLGAVLIISAIIGLLAAWYAGKSDVPATADSTGIKVVISTFGEALKTVLLVFGFSSLVVAIALFSTRNKPGLSAVLFSVATVLVILLITFAAIEFGETKWQEVAKLP